MRNDHSWFGPTAMMGSGLLFATAILGTPVAMAQTKGSAAPPGSYLQSCRDVSFKNGMLQATCKTKGTAWMIGAPLEVSYCSQRGGDIVNFAGQIECRTRSGVWGKGHAYPAGSYKQSCNHPQVQPGPKLVASCNNGSGQWVGAELDLWDCAMGRDIGVLNGQLLCAPYDGPPRPPRIRRK